MGTENVVYEKVKKSDENGTYTPTAPLPRFGTRHVQACILFICLAASMTMKITLSVSMVAMTGHGITDDFCPNTTNIDHGIDNFHDKYNRTDIDRTNRTIEDFYSEENELNNVTHKRETSSFSNLCNSGVKSKWSVYRKYNWSKSKQDVIVYSLFVGYTSMQTPMGYFAQKYGGKRPLMIGMIVSGLLSVAIPWVLIMGDWLALCVCRLVQGMTLAAFYPSLHTMLAKWAPLSERGRIGTYVYAGSPFGTIILFLISGILAGNPSLGWPSIFWFFGVFNLAAAVLLGCFGASSPHDHPGVSAEELIFITEGGSADLVPKNRKTPWKQILSCKAIWGLIATSCGSTLGYSLTVTQIPTYMNYVLNVEIKKNGIFSSLPFIALYFSTLIFGFLADYLNNKKIMSVVNIRRVANTIGIMISAIFLISFSFTNTTVGAVVLLILSLGTHSAIHVGYHINHIDLAPNFAGTIMGLCNSLANLTSLLVPVIVTNIVRDDLTNQHRWQIVFSIVGGVQIFTNALFVIFAKGTVQPWNFIEDNDTENDDTDQEKDTKGNNEIVKKTNKI